MYIEWWQIGIGGLYRHLTGRTISQPIDVANLRQLPRIMPEHEIICYHQATVGVRVW